LVEYAYYPGCSLHGTALEFDTSVKETARLLGVQLTEISDWNCCGASSAHMTDHELETVQGGLDGVPDLFQHVVASQKITDVVNRDHGCLSV